MLFYKIRTRTLGLIENPFIKNFVWQTNEHCSKKGVSALELFINFSRPFCLKTVNMV